MRDTAITEALEFTPVGAIRSRRLREIRSSPDLLAAGGWELQCLRSLMTTAGRRRSGGYAKNAYRIPKCVDGDCNATIWSGGSG